MLSCFQKLSAMNVLLSGVNLGQKKSRILLYCALFTFSGCYYIAYYSNQDNTSPLEADNSIDEQNDHHQQCRAMFTITPRVPLDNDNYFGLIEPLKQKLFHFFGSRRSDYVMQGQEFDMDGLERAVRAVIKARPFEVKTELYDAVAEYLPSLLVSDLSHKMLTNVFNYYSDMKNYTDGMITLSNTTIYRAWFLNKTRGFVPHHQLVSDLPKNPFSYGSTQRKEPEVIEEKFDVLPYSRLTLNKGYLPYIPCKIRSYSIDDLKQCVATRIARNASTWIAFVGDSKVRTRFECFLDSTAELGWNISTPNKVVSWEMYDKILRPLKIQISMDAHTSIGFNMSVAWASRGLFTDVFSGSTPVYHLQEWLRMENKIPDMIVISFGPWLYRQAFRYGLATLTAPDFVIKRWKTMKKVVKELTKRSTVLLMMQSRYRTLITKTMKPYNNSGMAVSSFFNVILDHETFYDHSTDWIDKVMITFARETGAILWDTSLPLNLANIRECGILKQAQQDNHPAYEDTMACTDYHHPSPPSIHDEFMMVLNYLCNVDLNQGEEYCCGGHT